MSTELKLAHFQVPLIHQTTIKENNGYHTPECSCGWKSGPWAGYANAMHDVYHHAKFVEEMLKLYAR